MALRFQQTKITNLRDRSWHSKTDHSSFETIHRDRNYENEEAVSYFEALILNYTNMPSTDYVCV